MALPVAIIVIITPPKLPVALDQGIFEGPKLSLSSGCCKMEFRFMSVLLLHFVTTCESGGKYLAISTTVNS